MDWLRWFICPPNAGGASGAAAQLVELAWYDGLRTGLSCGILGGAVLGVFLTYMIARISRERDE